jgi:uncharacterized protein (DUF58 family)
MSKRRSGYRFVDPAALARVKNLSLIAHGVVEGFIAGQHSSPYKGFSVEFAEHREYSPGDNLRHLDWRILGRSDRLYIKQYEEETNLRAQILLDTSGSMAFRHASGLTKLEYGCYLSAILAQLMIRQQDAVGITTFDTKVRCDMPARSTPRHFHDMMHQLEAIRPGRPTNVGDILHRLAERFKKRHLIVLISDLYDEVEVLERALHHLRHRKHEVIVFHVLDRAEMDLPFRDVSTFVDLETGERLQVDPTYLREEYRAQLTSFLDQCRRCCANCQIDYVQTDTSVPYDFMLSRYLATRRRL